MHLSGAVGSKARWSSTAWVPEGHGLGRVFLGLWIHESVLQCHGMDRGSCSEAKWYDQELCATSQHFLLVLVGYLPSCANGKGTILSYLAIGWTCVSLDCLMKTCEMTADSLF